MRRFKKAAVSVNGSPCLTTLSQPSPRRSVKGGSQLSDFQANALYPSGMLYSIHQAAMPRPSPTPTHTQFITDTLSATGNA